MVLIKKMLESYLFEISDKYEVLSKTMAGKLLIYGANGYTGELITRYAVERGMRPILAGRNAIAVEALAKSIISNIASFRSTKISRIDEALQNVDAVLALRRSVFDHSQADGRGVYQK